MQKYAEILKRLYSVNLFKGKKEDLHIMEKAAALIGNPHKELRFIHVAGTNGKGSVTTKCAKILELSGYKTGLFISPHISSFRERIQINGQLVEKEFVVEFLEELFKISEKHDLDLTFFDYVTLLGLQYFREKKADFVCLEVGLGGRLDATNIVDPLVSVITSIGLDHVETLGPTINHIAQEKAGIIKPKRPVVLGPCLPEEIFTQKATQTESPVFALKPDEFTVKDYNNENARIARETIKVICETYPDIKVPEHAITEGLKAFQPCRLEPVNTSVLNDPKLKETKVFLDVGHNLPAIEKCMITLTQQFPGRHIRVIYGSSEHKDTFGCFQALKDYAHKIHIVQAKHGRAKSLAKLRESVEQVKSELVEESASALFEEVVNEGDIESTLDYALKQSSQAEKPEVVVVIGSFYIMAEARQYFKYNDEFDPVF